ncbi:hypothetical protein NLU13_7782 [Sarocladium strictum]|uniref:Carboxylic ester hydrolase n=1 Tax=Sarocladium strictum TaxID=5046 RepID=A0AA39L5I8_SARSR|nr:hypothetical protein NLU13_7782 [Sarocladium strictum]
MAPLTCSPASFTSLSFPSIDVQSLSASPVTNFPIEDAVRIPNHGFYPSGTVEFCNVTIAYTHPNEESYPINFEAWLPSHESWNERLVAAGGSGFAAGRFSDTYRIMSGLINEGYVSFTTDGGAPNVTNFEFALKETGVLDEVALKNWGTVALGDMATIGKAVVKQYYGQPAIYSYFSGCSQAGRQGYEFAQRYPDAFDGIAATAPAFSMLDAFYNIFWPQFLMNQGESWPRGCEIDSLTNLAVQHCDERDGVLDGIISRPDLCEDFDPFARIGDAALACQDKSSTISEMAAIVVNASWTGFPDRDGGHMLYPGLFPGTDLTGNVTGAGIATTTCYETDQGCHGSPIELGYAPVRIFGAKDGSFDYTKLTFDQLYNGQEEAKRLVGRELQSFDPDLSAFRDRGGKLLTFHGLSDQLLSAGIVRRYYDQVSQRLDDVQDFYRYFEIPGLGHCNAGPQHPDSTFDALRLWVEEGVAPETLPYRQPDAEGNIGDRVACPYPQAATYKSCCGNPTLAECYECK